MRISSVWASNKSVRHSTKARCNELAKAAFGEPFALKVAEGMLAWPHVSYGRNSFQWYYIGAM